MNSKNIGLVVLLAALGVGAYTYTQKTTTYTGQCGPILFNYAKLGFSLNGQVSWVEKSGTKVNMSNIPCLYEEDK